MDYKIVEVKENILIENNQKAQELRERLTNKGICVFVISFPPLILVIPKLLIKSLNNSIFNSASA